MTPSKLLRVSGISAGLCGVALGAAFGCSESGPTFATSAGAAGQGAGAPNGAGGGSAGTAPNGGTPAAAGTVGTSAGAGGTAVGGATNSAGAGAGGSGVGGTAQAGAANGGTGGVAGSSTPCNSMPAATVPMLKRGPAITGFQGMQTAGSMVGVPGEAGILYVIGHRNGAVHTVKDGKVEATPLVTVNVANGGNNEQGLLSMALHPSFATNHLFYLFYTAANGGAMTVDEFERTTQTAATFKRNVYSQPRAGGGAFHNGGALAFNPKDAQPFLYFSVGNNESNDAGKPDGVAGRVLKIDLTSKLATTFAYGLRNPYRMSIDRLTGDMYIADVANGPGGTIIFSENGKTGTDFGYRNNNGAPDVNEGILRDSAGAAIIGGFVYRGNKIPGLCGRYFYGNHDGGAVKSIVVQGGKKVGDTVTHATLAVPGNITSFGEDGEGELYMASMNNTIYKIELAQ